jgi:hypothetical protein
MLIPSDHLQFFRRRLFRFLALVSSLRKQPQPTPSHFVIRSSRHNICSTPQHQMQMIRQHGSRSDNRPQRLTRETPADPGSTLADVQTTPQRQDPRHTNTLAAHIVARHAPPTPRWGRDTLPEPVVRDISPVIGLPVNKAIARNCSQSGQRPQTKHGWPPCLPLASPT